MFRKEFKQELVKEIRDLVKTFYKMRLSMINAIIKKNYMKD